MTRSDQIWQVPGGDDPLTAPLPAVDQPTEAFTPDWDDGPGNGRHAGPVRLLCSCGTPACPDSRQPDPDVKDAMLSCAPGVTERVWQRRVRIGHWENIPGLFDKAHANTHIPTLKRQGEIHLDLTLGVHQIGTVLDAHPDWRTDRDLAEGLHRAEEDVAEQGEALRRWVADRAAEIRRESERRAAA